MSRALPAVVDTTAAELQPGDVLELASLLSNTTTFKQVRSVAVGSVVAFTFHDGTTGELPPTSPVQVRRVVH